MYIHFLQLYRHKSCLLFAFIYFIHFAIADFFVVDAADSTFRSTSCVSQFVIHVAACSHSLGLFYVY